MFESTITLSISPKTTATWLGGLSFESHSMCLSILMDPNTLWQVLDAYLLDHLFPKQLSDIVMGWTALPPNHMSCSLNSCTFQSGCIWVINEGIKLKWGPDNRLSSDGAVVLTRRGNSDKHRCQECRFPREKLLWRCRVKAAIWKARREAGDRPLLYDPWRKQTPWILIPGPQKYKKINFCCLNSPVCGVLLLLPKESNIDTKFTSLNICA